MAELAKEKQQLVSLGPVDWGLLFALSNWRIFIWPALATLVIEAAAIVYRFYVPIELNKLFLLGVLVGLGNAWLVGVCAMFTVEELQGSSPKLEKIFLRALRLLPKVFLSYLLVMLAFGLVMFVPAALLLLLFVMWGPAFVVGETYAPLPAKEEEEDEDDDLLDEDVVNERYYRERVKRALSAFTGKGIFDLGLARSIRFASINLGSSIQLALLFGCANAVPMAVVLFLFNQGHGLTVQLAQAAAAKLVHTLIVGAWAAAFIGLLPLKAKEEIKIPGRFDTPLRLPNRALKVLRIQGRPLINIVLVTAAAISVYFILRVATNSTRMPPSVSYQVTEAQKIGEQFVVRLRFVDSQDRLRWLDPTMFQLEYVNLKDERSAPLDHEKKPEAKDALRPALRAEVTNEKGEGFGKRDFRPTMDPVIVSLYFDQAPNMPDQGEFRLFYRQRVEPRPAIYQGNYGQGTGLRMNE